MFKVDGTAKFYDLTRYFFKNSFLLKEEAGNGYGIEKVENKLDVFGIVIEFMILLSLSYGKMEIKNKMN